MQQKLRERLRVVYFMVTFTLPEQLHLLCYHHPERFYRLFFACAAQALKDILGDPKHMGGQCGFFGLFQSWQQNLLFHPHLHFVVPGIGLTKTGQLRYPRKSEWLVRGEVLACRLRTLLLRELKNKALLAPRRIGELWQIDWYRGACLRHLNERSENNTAM